STPRTLHVGLVFEQDGQRAIERLRVERARVKRQQRPRPVQRFADARVLLEIQRPQRLHYLDRLPREFRRQPRHLQLHDPQFLFGVRIVDVEVQAAPLERFAQLAGVVAGQEHDRPEPRDDRPDYGHAHLEVAQRFEQKRLKLGVGAVDLVNQQDDWLVAADGAKQRARQQEAFREEDVFFLTKPVRRLGQRARIAQQMRQLVAQKLRVEHLLGVFPLVQGLALVQPFVTLQAHQLAARRGGPGFAQFGLPYPGGAFRQQRLAERLGQKQDSRDLVGGDVLLIA